jgi:hypothetical protein
MDFEEDFQSENQSVFDLYSKAIEGIKEDSLLGYDFVKQKAKEREDFFYFVLKSGSVGIRYPIHVFMLSAILDDDMRQKYTASIYKNLKLQKAFCELDRQVIKEFSKSNKQEVESALNNSRFYHENVQFPHALTQAHINLIQKIIDEEED